MTAVTVCVEFACYTPDHQGSFERGVIDAQVSPIWRRAYHASGWSTRPSVQASHAGDGAASRGKHSSRRPDRLDGIDSTTAKIKGRRGIALVCRSLAQQASRADAIPAAVAKQILGWRIRTIICRLKPRLYLPNTACCSQPSTVPPPWWRCWWLGPAVGVVSLTLARLRFC